MLTIAALLDVSDFNVLVLVRQREDVRSRKQGCHFQDSWRSLDPGRLHRLRIQLPRCLDTFLFTSGITFMALPTSSDCLKGLSTRSFEFVIVMVTNTSMKQPQDNYTLKHQQLAFLFSTLLRLNNLVLVPRWLSLGRRPSPQKHVANPYSLPGSEVTTKHN